MRETLLPFATLGIGCFTRLGVWFLFVNEEVVGTPDTVLTSFALGKGLMDSWGEISRRDSAKMLFAWATIVGGGVYVILAWDLEPFQTGVCIASLAFTTNIVGSLTLSILHICQGIILILDDFCVGFATDKDCEAGVQEWNVLQAMLRRVCSAVARTYILLLTGALVAMLLPVTLGSSLWAMAPAVLALLSVSYVSFFIAEVTSKCDRVPAFVNTLDLGEALDYNRQYLVDYVINSRAGFYMFEIRITSEMVVKAVYVGFVIATAFISSRLSTE